MSASRGTVCGNGSKPFNDDPPFGIAAVSHQLCDEARMVNKLPF
jgi:hypothetical protein